MKDARDALKGTEELVIRPVHPRDAADLYAIISDARALRTLIRLPSMEFRETQAWMQAQTPGRHRLVAQLGERVVGQVALTQSQNPRMAHLGQLGLMIHPDYWGRGLGSALTAAALDLADNWLNLRRVELDVFCHNSAAIRVYEKHGFEVEGTRRAAAFGEGRWLDEHLMARLRGFEGQHSSPAAPEGNFSAPGNRRQVKVTVRPPRIEDAEALYFISRQPQVCRTTLQLPSQEIHRTESRLNETVPGIHRLVAEADGRPVGQAALIQSQVPRLVHSAGLGMMVHPEYWGLGVGSALMEALVSLADGWLNLKRIELDVNTDNPAGIHLYRKFGFEVEGLRRFHSYGDGRWSDNYFMARVRDEAH
jgi:putative acetyltransferase